MSKESNIDYLVIAIRSDIDYIKKYENYLRDFDENLKKSSVELTLKLADSNLTDEDMVEYGIENFSEKNYYLNDIKILYTRIVNYYKALVIIGGKDLLNKEESELLEGLHSRLPSVNFVFDEKGDIKEKTKGFLEKVKASLREGDTKNQLLSLVKNFLQKKETK